MRAEHRYEHFIFFRWHWLGRLQRRVKPSRRPTLTLLLAACAFILRRDMNYAIGVNVEGDLDLRNAAGGGGDSHQSELPQHLVVGGHLSLTLTHLDLYLGLSVSCGGEDLGGGGGVSAVAHSSTKKGSSGLRFYVPGPSWWELWCSCWWV